LAGEEVVDVGEANDDLAEFRDVTDLVVAEVLVELEEVRERASGFWESLMALSVYFAELGSRKSVRRTEGRPP
jgi:hypothetical protein